MSMTADGLEYQLVRGNRKTVAVTIRPGGVVEVRAPRWVTLQQVESFLTLRRGWIDAHCRQVLQEEEQRAAFRIEPGMCMPFVGQECPVRIGKTPHFDGTSFFIDPTRSAKQQIAELYRAAARRIITERLERYAPLVGVQPSGVRITSAATRFGSCSGKNSLSFTWKLVMAEMRLIDYVVVHELCHILEHNHSNRFWSEVERVLPDYRERKQELRQFSSRLWVQDWSD